MSKVARLAALVMLSVFFSATLCIAQGEANRYVIIPDNAADINAKTDYFSVSLVQGWLSSRHSFLQSLLSTGSKFTVLINGEATFFDGQRIDAVTTSSNTDIRRGDSKPWGINPTLFPRLPGDVDMEITTQLAIYQEDTMARVLTAVDQSKASIPADVIASPALGYARAVSNIFRALFGTDKTRYPFIWSGSLKSSSVPRTSDGIKEHYLILVAPRDRHDEEYRRLDASRLSFDLASQRLRYNNTPVTEWSFAVFYIKKEQPYDINNMANGSSAPWATLIVNVFRAIPADESATAQELRTLSRTLVTQLTNETDLLKRELRFSDYSRGLVLASLASHAKDQIAARCVAIKIETSQCPTSQLEQIAKKATEEYRQPFRVIDTVDLEVTRLKRELFTQ